MPVYIDSYESARQFSIFSYQHGHGMLLFRSGKRGHGEKRVDLLIKDVRVLETRTFSSGLAICTVEPAALSTRLSRPLSAIERGHRAYLLSGSDWEGFVVGGPLWLHEDDAEFGAASGFEGVGVSPRAP